MQATEVELQLCYESPSARPIKKEAVEALSESIRECGLLQPITVRVVEKSRAGQMTSAFEVIAGMHRVKACRWLGWSTIPANVIEADDLHAELMLIDENLVRNDLSPAERSAAQARRKAIYQELHPETKVGAGTGGSGSRTKDDLAKLAKSNAPAAARFDEAAAQATGQSERSVRRDVHRGEALGEAALAKVARTSLDKGEELDALAKCTPEKQRELIDRAAAGEKVSAKVELKKEVRADREEILGRKQLALPTQKFGVIVADPEWRFEPWSRSTGMDRAADNHYPTSVTSVIAERDVASIAADDCMLFLWATGPMIREALAVMDAWGFEYKSQVIWRKPAPITGYWFRSVHELLLVGTRGHIPAPAMGTQCASVIDAPSPGPHSAKPECFLELIEQYFPTLPKIELNRRGPARPGWSAWGNEATEEYSKSDDAPPPDRGDDDQVQEDNISQVDCRVCSLGAGVCAECIAAADHVASIDEPNGLATCSCGWLMDAFDAPDCDLPAAIKAHWQNVVTEARASAESVAADPVPIPEPDTDIPASLRRGPDGLAPYQRSEAAE